MLNLVKPQYTHTYVMGDVFEFNGNHFMIVDTTYDMTPYAIIMLTGDGDNAGLTIARSTSLNLCFRDAMIDRSKCIFVGRFTV